MPTRKGDSKPFMITSTQGKNIKSGTYLSKMNRKELEDSFSRLQEESLLVKELSWKQEDQIKRMRTKLLRLTAEGRTSGDANRCSRNLKTEEAIENLKDQVWQLQRQNEGLNNRLLMYKQQLQVQSSGCSQYSCVQRRINTGRRQLHTSDAQIQTKLKRGPPTRPSYTAPPIYKEHLMEEVRAEMASEPRVQIMTNNTVKVDEPELSPKSPEKMWSKDEDCEKKSSLEYAQLATEYRASIRENVERIQMMRLLHERSSALVAAKAQLADLQENQGMLSTSHNALLSQVDELNTELKEKNKKVVSLESQLADMSVLRITMNELQDRVEDLKRERNLLKGNHDRLLKNMLNGSSQPHWSTDLMKERLQQKVSHLQEQLDSEVAEKRKIWLQLAKEQAENVDLKQEVTQILMKHKKEVELLRQKTPTMTTTSSQSDPDFLQPSHQDYTKETQTHELNSLLEIQEEEKNLSRAYDDMKAAHAETTLELEKTREMLLMQHQMNKHYQDELEIVKAKADNSEREHKEEWEKLNQLLDLKNNRIQQLEAQLKDVAYGTLRFPLHLETPIHGENMVDYLQLHQGENLFELHIHQAYLSPAALSQAGDAQLASFCTYSFYDFEIHCTPLAVGPQPLYDFTSQYVVRTDYLFLNYLQGALSRINLHQTAALDHNTLAVGWLHFDKVLETVEKVHCTAMLTGNNGKDFGTLDYWMRLKFPIAHCLQAYNKQLKAQAYLSANVLGARKAQPEEASFPVHMTLELDQYLRQTVLPIYVFDDNESEIGWFLGKVQVPLLPLAQDKAIQGNFNLNNPVGKPNGSIELKLEWESHYLSPESLLKSATQSVENENKVPLSVENYKEVPLSVEKHNKANLQVEDYNEALSSAENKETEVRIEHYSETPLSVENYNEAPLCVENFEAPLSAKKYNEANLSVEDYNEADLSMESYNEANLHIDYYKESLSIENYEVNSPIENKDEVKSSKENCDEAKLVIENFSEAKLSIENFDEVKLSIENLDETELSIENFEEAKFSIKNLDETKLSIENLDETKLSIENLDETKLSIENFEEAKLSIENLDEAKLSIENLDETKLSTENFEEAKLSIENLDETKLSIENFEEAKLSMENLKEAELSMENLEEAELSMENLEEAELSMENLEEAELSMENLEEADVSVENLEEAKLSVENLEEADMSMENLEEAKLSMENLEETKLSMENFKEAKLSVENLGETKLSIENFDEAKLSTETFEEAKLSTEDFEEDKLSTETFEEAKLSIENFEEAKQSIENFEEAKQSIENFEEAKQSIENFEEDKLSIKNCDWDELSMENCDEATQSMENDNEMLLLVEDYTKAPDLIENYERPIEIPEEENILFHQVNEKKLLGATDDAKKEPEECYPEVKQQESPSPDTAYQPSEQADEVSETQTTDSDDVIVTPLSQKGPKTNSDKICIEIVSLTFDPEAEVMSDKSIQQVYVEYKFHDLPLSETETPVSLRKPRAGEDIHFHFNKVIDLNPVEHRDRRKFLFSMLQEKNPEQRQLKFIVVSDPEEQKNECQEVGYAYLELWQILDTGRDILEQEIDIINPQDKATSIGKLKVSLQATDALQAIFKEMSEDMHL